MIKSIHFKNLKALRDTKLELGRFTLLIGPNGSGKSTVLQALVAARGGGPQPTITAGLAWNEQNPVMVTIKWGAPFDQALSQTYWPNPDAHSGPNHSGPSLSREGKQTLGAILSGIRIYAFQPERLFAPVPLVDKIEFAKDGFGLGGVLDRLRDQHPERFEALNEELARWIPEFERILFELPHPGRRAISLRLRGTDHRIQAADLSQGTLFALAILTLAYLPDPPPVVGLEEPDHGMHPRLLRDVRDAIYRLCYPENFGEKRQPVQVIATTHSPYMLDLFRDHPEEIVICRKTEDNLLFERLSDRPDLDEILKDTHLGDAWYSGILGGVPAQP